MLGKIKTRLLNYSVGKINGLDKTSLTYQTKRGIFLVPMVLWGAATAPEVQEDYMGKIGFKKEHAKYFTVANALVGFGTAAAWYYGGKESSDILERFADFLGVTVNIVNYGYNVGWNALQNAGRIVNVIRTGKPQLSLSITGLGGTVILKGIGKTIQSVRERRLEQIVQEHK